LKRRTANGCAGNAEEIHVGPQGSHKNAPQKRTDTTANAKKGSKKEHGAKCPQNRGGNKYAEQLSLATNHKNGRGAWAGKK